MSAMIHEIGPQNRLIGKGYNRTASKPVLHLLTFMQIEIMT